MERILGKPTRARKRKFLIELIKFYEYEYLLKTLCYINNKMIYTFNISQFIK